MAKSQVDDDGDTEEALQPKNTFNPVLQRVYQNLEVRALDNQADIQPLEPRILAYFFYFLFTKFGLNKCRNFLLRYVNPDKDLFDKAKDEIKNFQNCFKFKVNGRSFFQKICFT